MHSRLAMLIGVISVAGSGCGDSKWVTMPMMDCETIKELEQDPENFAQAMGQHMGPSACRDSGGLSYTGDYRCAGDKVEVHCEQQ
jgi:hypothetical protein